MLMRDKASIVEEIKFYTEYAPPFLGVSKDILEADFAILGVPYDYTSTYRPGSRFAPDAIRRASMFIEAYSPTIRRDCEHPSISDIGNLTISNDPRETLGRIGKVASLLKELGKVQITIGGEHTITKGCIPPLIGGGGGLLCLDAHLDLRDEFQGTKLSHATFMRRIIEEMGPGNAIFIGARAFSQEELEYASQIGIKIISARTFNSLNVATLKEIVQRGIGGRPLYLSIDLDVIDPSFAPAVGNPEPYGIPPSKLIELLAGISMDNEVVGADLVEVSPEYDDGTTIVLAAKMIVELISMIRAPRREA
ncbi:MAG: agmatinase [Candidatus Bathyarchaeia archaeon]